MDLLKPPKLSKQKDKKKVLINTMVFHGKWIINNAMFIFPIVLFGLGLKIVNDIIFQKEGYITILLSTFINIGILLGLMIALIKRYKNIIEIQFKPFLKL